MVMVIGGVGGKVCEKGECWGRWGKNKKKQKDMRID